jgi:hypothetical protein
MARANRETIPMRTLQLTFLAALGLAVAAFGLLWTGTAMGSITAYEVSTSTTQAGGHPDVYTLVGVENRFQSTSSPRCNCQDAKNITIHLPTGVIGDPHATPRCTDADFSTGACSPDSQVGLASAGLSFQAPGEGGATLGNMAVYNLIPHPGQAGLLGIYVSIVNAPLYIVIDSRTESDYGLDAKITNITHILPLSYAETELWGVPADPSHTEDRHPGGCDPSAVDPTRPCYPGISSNSPLKPFIDNPTTCGVPLTARVDVLSYDGSEDHASAPYPPTTGCDQLSFNPSLFGQPTESETDAASGIDIDLKVPDVDSPAVPSPSEIKATSVTLPEGFSINPNAADGKVACTDEQARFGSREAAQCPEHAKVGTLSIESSALPGPLPGFIYLGEPKPGERFRLILVADGFNLHIKLPGTAVPDPQTGRLTVSFRDLPQTPFSRFNMHFFGSERALNATPIRCGTYGITSTFAPWDGLLAEQTSSQFFSLTSGPNGKPCPTGARPFDPGFRAGVTDKTAGSHPSFILELKREDGDQYLRSLEVSTPPGFSASLAGVSYCSEAAIAATADPNHNGIAERDQAICPASSKIGTGSTGVGAGTHQVYFPSRVYLAGPYKGAPLSMVVVTPSLTGPYDLNNVVVRAALFVDSTDAHVTAIADQLPLIHEGVPLRIRTVLINLDRPKFALNPTNCRPLSIGAKVGGAEDALLSLSRHFQVANCATLPFSPKLSFSLRGGTKRGGNPALSTVLAANPGDSNIARVVVTLPPSEQLDNAHIGNVCTRVRFAEDNCPATSEIGSATAQTPLLDKPLNGKVYLRSSSNPLPDMVVALRGQIDFNLVGRIDSSKNLGLRTTFEAVPDVPVGKFSLSLKGGSKGLLINNRDICANKPKAKIHFKAQNGKTAGARVPLNPPCGNQRHKRKGKKRLLQARKVG